MRFLAFESDGCQGLAVTNPQGELFGLLSSDLTWPGDLDQLLASAQPNALSDAVKRLLVGKSVDISKVNVRAPLAKAPKIICVGLNYAGHAKEMGPSYQTTRRFSGDSTQV